jgi:hypothetical protein
MYWVVQNNIYKEQKHSILMKTLKEKKIPHIEVKVVPFSDDKLLPSEFDSHEYKGIIDDIKGVEIPNNTPVMVLGGTTLAKIAERRGWNPGSFLNENFHYNQWKNALGDYLLNSEAMVGNLRDINPAWDTFFIRPCEDTKDFSGIVYTKEGFNRWREELLKDEDSYPFINSEVVSSPVKIIEAEYRFFVVDGHIVTYSQYKLGDKLYKNATVDKEVIQFTKEMINLWQPARAFVIDIAKTNEGYKVIEINNFNSAGFYDADVVKIIDAIENMKI